VTRRKLQREVAFTKIWATLCGAIDATNIHRAQTDLKNLISIALLRILVAKTLRPRPNAYGRSNNLLLLRKRVLFLSCELPIAQKIPVEIRRFLLLTNKTH
jgi:hypothetical protein